MNLNRGQLLSIAIVILGVLVAGSAQLTELFGVGATKAIVAAANLLMSAMAGVNTVLQSQGSQVAAVQAMPGVEKIVVNANANQTLAAIAVDPANPKVEALPQAQAAVEATAKQG